MLGCFPLGFLRLQDESILRVAESFGLIRVLRDIRREVRFGKDRIVCIELALPTTKYYGIR